MNERIIGHGTDRTFITCSVNTNEILKFRGRK
jgi:hypothetical protein